MSIGQANPRMFKMVIVANNRILRGVVTREKCGERDVGRTELNEQAFNRNWVRT